MQVVFVLPEEYALAISLSVNIDLNNGLKVSAAANGRSLLTNAIAICTSAGVTCRLLDKRLNVKNQTALYNHHYKLRDTCKM